MIGFDSLLRCLLIFCIFDLGWCVVRWLFSRLIVGVTFVCLLNEFDWCFLVVGRLFVISLFGWLDDSWFVCDSIEVWFRIRVFLHSDAMVFLKHFSCCTWFLGLLSGCCRVGFVLVSGSVARFVSLV